MYQIESSAASASLYLQYSTVTSSRLRDSVYLRRTTGSELLSP